MNFATPQEAGIDRFHWTVDVFYRALDARVFDEPKLAELVRGDIQVKLPASPEHAFWTEQIARRFRAILEPKFWVREEKPLSIARHSEPTPDIQVLVKSDLAYVTQHPGPEDVRLLVEVSDTSLSYDLGTKAALYAQAGISDYWVSDINGGRLLVHRDPTQMPGGEWVYRSVTPLIAGQSVSPLWDAGVTISVTDLLPRAS